jgi:hypothetical protein
MIDAVKSVPGFYSTTVTPYFHRPAWLMSAINDVVEISQMPQNWNSYNSPPLTQEAKAQAYDVLIGLSTKYIPEPSIAPVAGGGVQFAWTLGPRSLELEVLPDGAIEYLLVYSDKTMREGRINPEVASERLTDQVRWLVEHP